MGEDLAQRVEELERLTAANILVVDQLVRIIHRDHPEEIEAAMNRQRLVVQEARAGRLELTNPASLPIHRIARDQWERALGLRADLDPADKD